MKYSSRQILKTKSKSISGCTVAKMKRSWGKTANGYGFSFGGDESILGLDKADDQINLQIYEKPLKCKFKRMIFYGM